MDGWVVDHRYEIVNDGWAVMAHDYSGIKSRGDYTKYPEATAHGHMEAKKMGYHLIYDRMPDGSQMKNPEATSHFLWNAVQRRVLSYLLAKKSTRGVSAPRVTPTEVRLCGTWEWTPGQGDRCLFWDWMDQLLQGPSRMDAQ